MKRAASLIDVASCITGLRIKAIKTLIVAGHVRQKVNEKLLKDDLIPFTASRNT